MFFLLGKFLYFTQSVKQTICNSFELAVVFGLEEVRNV
jgi:hypothetical protein